jgi:TatD DNase family protein
MKLLDSHAHLTDEKFAPDLDAVLERAREAGVARILNAGSDLADSEKVVALAEAHDGMHAAVGIHPHEAKAADGAAFERLRELAKNAKVLAVGETGLDYHYDNSPREAQREAFRRHVRLAKDTGLPLVVHSREAEEDTLRVLDEEEGWLTGGIFHSFTGSERMARAAVENGWMVSLSGIVTFPSSDALRDVVKKLPYENLLIETDCPYLAPVPVRGKRNEPAFVVHTAEAVAQFMPLSPGDVARITLANFERLFRLSTRPEEDTYAYPIRDSLYLNLTSRCTNECSFCVREHLDGVSGYYLWLRKEPSVQEVLGAVGDPSGYDEIVFCGFGEPTLRLDVIKAAAKELRKRGARGLRLTTNGHANLIHGRNVVPELVGVIDRVSVSLDAHDSKTYQEVCRPKFKRVDVFAEVLKFAEECVRLLPRRNRGKPKVELTAVADPRVNVEVCKRIAEKMGATFRARGLNVVG